MKMTEKKESETSEPKTKEFNFTEKFRENPWILATFALGSVALVFLIISLSASITGNAVSGDIAGQKLVDYYTSLGVENLTLDSVKEVSGLYQINVLYNENVIPLYMTKDGKNIIEGLTPAEQEEEESPQTPDKTVSECAQEYDIEEKVIFYYSNSCGWCAKMKLGVESLEGEGYKFYWAEASDSDASKVINNCVRDHMTSSGVPQFICVRTGEIHVGAFVDENSDLDKDALRTWVDNCLSD